jgi:hypothetical protein
VAYLDDADRELTGEARDADGRLIETVSVPRSTRQVAAELAHAAGGYEHVACRLGALSPRRRRRSSRAMSGCRRPER